MADDLYNRLAFGGNQNDQEAANVGDALTLGLGGFGARAGREGAVNEVGQIPALQFQQAGYQAPGYAGDFAPQMYQDPVAADASLASDSGEGRSAQIAALQQMSQATDQSATSQAALGRYQAGLDANQMAQAREGAIRQDAMTRGQIGGPADMIAREQAAQAGANRNLDLGLQSAQQAALLRLSGLQAGGALAGQVRGQDQATAFANQNAINSFNMYNNQNVNAIRQANTGLGNSAQQANIGARQNYLGGLAQAANANVARNDANAQAIQGAAANKASAISNAMSGAVNSQQSADTANRGQLLDILKSIGKGVGAGAAGKGE